MDFLRIYFLRNETLLSWTFPVIKIRFSLSNVLIRRESDFDDWKCPTQQSHSSRNYFLKNPYFSQRLLNRLRSLCFSTLLNCFVLKTLCSKTKPLRIVTSTVNSRFKKPHFSFLKSRVVWFKKDLCTEFKNRSSEKNASCT